MRRLERGRFLWPTPADGTAVNAPAKMGNLLSGLTSATLLRCGVRRTHFALCTILLAHVILGVPEYSTISHRAPFALRNLPGCPGSD